MRQKPLPQVAPKVAPLLLSPLCSSTTLMCGDGASGDCAYLSHDMYYRDQTHKPMEERTRSSPPPPRPPVPAKTAPPASDASPTAEMLAPHLVPAPTSCILLRCCCWEQNELRPPVESGDRPNDQAFAGALPTLRSCPMPAQMTGVCRQLMAGNMQCNADAPPSPFSRRFNRDDEGVPAK